MEWREVVFRSVRWMPVVASVGLAHPMPAQRTDTTGASMLHLMAQAIPLVTRATPTANRQSLTEAYLSRPMVMVSGERGPLETSVTVNFEGLTMSRGELSTGAQGEGYVDRRHPHTYLHEVMLGVDGATGPVGMSLFAGRGFAPFGSDDPMVRPFEKYPVNHHLAQIVERLVTVGAARWRTVVVEAGLFNGDEPAGPSAAPRYERFGDSWATRLTWSPVDPLELSASAARVTSPEVAAGGGLDQAKRSMVARWKQSSPGRETYLFGEWARSTLYTTFGERTGSYDSWLAESSACRNGARLSARLERTDRPEEDRLTDPFRTPNPPSDNSSLGVTRWTTATVALSSPASAGPVVMRPFLEVARSTPRRLIAGSFFDPVGYYGSTELWMASIGARVAIGQGHDRMGRYGAALPRTKSMDDGMEAMPGMTMSGHSMPKDRCGE